MLNPLYQAVAFCLVHIYFALRPVFGAGTGASWALSIVLLTLAMRIVLIPLFVKQIRLQRQMTVLQPKIKELQAKYKGDKERLNQEMMALYREHGANPLTGCLPLLLQFPIFIGLFHILDAIKPQLVKGHQAALDCAHGVSSCYTFHGLSVPGFSSTLIKSAARAKIFGVPIASNFTASAQLLHFLNASSSSTKVLVAILIVAMGATTFVTQRQLLGRSGPSAQMASQQKTLMYVLPFVFLIFGFRFQLGVLLYWVTSNLWAMVQQRVVIKRMNTEPAPVPAAVAVGQALAPRPGQRPAPAPAAPAQTGPSSGSPGAPPAAVGARPGGGGRNRRNRRGGRR
ncbi:MAG: membrane protein insertase YidC [Mycobacteriales bacterium]